MRAFLIAATNVVTDVIVAVLSCLIVFGFALALVPVIVIIGLGALSESLLTRISRR